MNNMAKLNVVIPAVEVTVGDVTYRKVDRKAQAGDIVKALTDEDGDITQGAFYGVFSSPSGKLGFRDDVNDVREYQLRTLAHNYEVYAPISEPATATAADTITFEGATWLKVDRDVREGDAIKFTDEERYRYLTDAELYVVTDVDIDDNTPFITDDDGDEIGLDGYDFEVYEKVAEEKAETSTQEYREVKRRANVGERIKIVDRLVWETRYADGDTFVVAEDAAGGDVVIRTENFPRVCVVYSEYVVLEPVTKSAEPTQPERLAVGDYARVVSTSGAFVPSYIVAGNIIKIAQDDESHRPFRGELTNGKNAGWFTESELVRATDEEVAAAKDTRSQFAAGDKVRLVSGGKAWPLTGFEDGEVYTVSNPKDTHHGGKCVEIKRASGNTGYALPSQLVKLTAAEIAEIERKQAEEAAKRAEEEARRREETKWNEIGRKVNEFKRGDIVEIVRKRDSVRGVGAVEDVGNQAVGVRMASEAHTFGTEYYGAFISNGDTITLIVPVEQRFDRAEEVDAA